MTSWSTRRARSGRRCCWSCCGASPGRPCSTAAARCGRATGGRPPKRRSGAQAKRGRGSSSGDQRRRFRDRRRSKGRRTACTCASAPRETRVFMFGSAAAQSAPAPTFSPSRASTRPQKEPDCLSPTASFDLPPGSPAEVRSASRTRVVPSKWTSGWPGRREAQFG